MAHKSTLLSLVLLLVTTSFALLRLSEAIGSDARLSSPQQTIQTVRRYYAALNAFLASGELDEVTSLVDASELAVLPEEGAFGNGSELATYLLAIRSSNPDLKIVVNDIEASGEIAIARVVRVGAGTVDSPTSEAPEISSSEFFRVRGNRVVEHWQTTPPPTGVHDVLAEDATVRVDRPGRLVMAHLSFWPDANRYLAIPGPGIILLTAGTLELVGDGLTEVVDIETGERRTTVSGSTVVVTTGQAIFIPRQQVVTRNVSAEAASARIMVVASDAPEITAAGMDRAYEADETAGFAQALLGATETVYGTAGVVIHPLAVSTGRAEPGSWTFAFGWTVIDPGSRYQIADGGGTAVTATISGSTTVLEEGASPGSGSVLCNDGDRPALVLLARIGPGS